MAWSFDTVVCQLVSIEHSIEMGGIFVLSVPEFFVKSHLLVCGMLEKLQHGVEIVK